MHAHTHTQLASIGKDTVQITSIKQTMSKRVLFGSDLPQFVTLVWICHFHPYCVALPLCLSSTRVLWPPLKGNHTHIFLSSYIMVWYGTIPTPSSHIMLQLQRQRVKVRRSTFVTNVRQHELIPYNTVHTYRTHVPSVRKIQTHFPVRTIQKSDNDTPTFQKVAFYLFALWWLQYIITIFAWQVFKVDLQKNTEVEPTAPNKNFWINSTTTQRSITR